VFLTRGFQRKTQAWRRREVTTKSIAPSSVT